jgi:hypothetical protein
VHDVSDSSATKLCIPVLGRLYDGLAPLGYALLRLAAA